jgi:GlpG protein
MTEIARAGNDDATTNHLAQCRRRPRTGRLSTDDEDHVPRARQELEEFQRNPTDPRYQSAAQTADKLRQRKRQEDSTYFRRQERFNRRMSGSISSQRLTVGLIGICVLVSLVSQGGHDLKIVSKLSISPYRYMGNTVEWLGLTPIAEGEIWRLVTPVLLHFGIWHLLFNMWMLYDLGGAVERQRGPFRYLLLILVLAVISNLVQYYFGHPVMDGSELKWIHLPTFGGMSGVIYGLFGYIWMKARFQPQLGLYIDPGAVTYLIAWFFLCMTGWVGPIANGAHVGGLLAGIAIGFIPTVWSR